jgi:dihydropteroate synthase
VADVTAYLAARAEEAMAQGVPRACLAVDPGIGFGKTVEHNVRLLARLDALARLGLPVVVGVSRKSFLGRLTGAPVQERLAASLAALVFCVLHGAQVLRVHDVKESRDAVAVARALEEAGK